MKSHFSHYRIFTRDFLFAEARGCWLYNMRKYTSASRKRTTTKTFRRSAGASWNVLLVMTWKWNAKANTQNQEMEEDEEEANKIIIIKFFACLFAFKQNFFILFFCTRMLCNVSVCCCECVRVYVCICSLRFTDRHTAAKLEAMYPDYIIRIRRIHEFSCSLVASRLHQFLKPSIREHIRSPSSVRQQLPCNGRLKFTWMDPMNITCNVCVMKIVIMVVAWPEFFDIWPLYIVSTIFFAYSSLFIVLQCRCRQVRRMCFSWFYIGQSLMRALLHMKCGWSLVNRNFSFEFTQQIWWALSVEFDS